MFSLVWCMHIASWSLSIEIGLLGINSILFCVASIDLVCLGVTWLTVVSRGTHVAKLGLAWTQMASLVINYRSITFSITIIIVCLIRSIINYQRIN